MMKFTDPCITTFKAIHHDGRRPISSIHLVVLHVAEAPNAKGVAEYFTQSDSGGSTQLVVDAAECYRCLDNTVIPWGAAGANGNGMHIEHAGYAAWSKDRWLNEGLGTIKRGAFKTAQFCHRHNIPVRFLTQEYLNNSVKGITSHHEVNLWQARIGAPGDHSHTCPGLNFPIPTYMEWVKHYHSQM